MKRSAGFTLIELILVIAILGVLAISALPKFLSVTEEAANASALGVVGAVRSGIALYKANEEVTLGAGQGAYPASLDTLADGTTCATTSLCFATVLANGVEDGNWTKVNATTYSHTVGATTTTYAYDSVNGTFTP